MPPLLTRKPPSPPAARPSLTYYCAFVWQSLFGIYAGFIYNDAFSVATNLFGSRYEWDPPVVEYNMYGNATRHKRNAFRTGDVDDVYPFGIDPVWRNAQNELMFDNSLKMKMAVIIGVVHMSFGICMKLANTRFFAKLNKEAFAVEFWLEALPQVRLGGFF